MKIQIVIITLVSALLLGACQSPANTPLPVEGTTSMPVETLPEATNPVEQVSSSTPDVPSGDPIEPSGSLPPVKVGTPSRDGQKMASLALADLSERLNVKLDVITVNMIQPVIWPDASLGCPQPDTVYAQMLTNGFVVMLEVDGQKHIYHTDESETVVFCKDSDLPMFPVAPGEIDDGQPWVPVK